MHGLRLIRFAPLALALVLCGSLRAGQKPDPCTEACTASRTACLACVAECLRQSTGDQEVRKTCIELCLDCADICGACASVSARGGSLEPIIAEACAEACDRCAAECAKWSDIDDESKACAEACKECAAACRAAAKRG